MTTTLTYQGELIITSCYCGIRVAVPEELYRWAKTSAANNIYCPVGHTFVFREYESKRLRRELEIAKRRGDNARERAEALERRLSAA